MVRKPDGVLFALLVFLSSLLGAIFILFPFTPLIILAPRAWRFCADRFVGYWLTFPASLIEHVFGTRFRITGDLILRDKPALFIMNHRTRLDWMFLWNILYKMDPWLLISEKISLKAPLKRIPGAGWAMSCANFLFLERNFEMDKKNIEKTIKYYSESGSNYQMLLFPEGTDRGERATNISHAYADKNGLPRYDYTLHPRTTGFNFMLNLMEKYNYIDYVYDITLAYPDHIVQSELDLVKNGKFPKEVHADVRRIPIGKLPIDEGERSEWLLNIWKEKEEKLKKFYTNDRKLEPSGERFVWPLETTGIGYCLAFAFWVLSSIFWIYITCTYLFVKLYVAAGMIFYIYMQRYKNGVEWFIIDSFYS